MKDEEHQRLVELEDQGKVLIGVDRIVARRFYTDLPISTIEKETGEAPYLDKLVVWFAFLMGPLALAASLVLAFVAFKWWGLIYLVVCPLIYLAYSSASVRGDSALPGISIIMVAAVCIHFLGPIANSRATGFVSLFLLSLWSVRFLYCSSTFLFRCFVIRNARAFRFLSDRLKIRYV